MPLNDAHFRGFAIDPLWRKWENADDLDSSAESGMSVRDRPRGFWRDRLIGKTTVLHRALVMWFESNTRLYFATQFESRNS